MASANTERSERIDLRLSGTAKRRIEQAAAIEGTTVPGFHTQSAPSKAFGPQPVPARYRLEGRAGRM